MNIKQQINENLEMLLGKELAELWWQRPNAHFDEQTPQQVFEQNPKRVFDYVTQQP